MTLKEIVVGTDGTLRFVYDDATAELLADLGPGVTIRASHVEPCTMHPQFWRADMAPVGGPYLPLPDENTGGVDGCCFATRNAALSAEAGWLSDHNIPMPVARVRT